MNRCEAFTFDGIESRPCTRPASKDRDGRRCCAVHARQPLVRWTKLDILAVDGPTLVRPWWTQEDDPLTAA